MSLSNNTSISVPSYSSIESEFSVPGHTPSGGSHWVRPLCPNGRQFACYIGRALDRSTLTVTKSGSCSLTKDRPFVLSFCLERIKRKKHDRSIVTMESTCRIEFWNFGLSLKAVHKVEHEPSLHLTLNLTTSVLIACPLFFFRFYVRKGPTFMGTMIDSLYIYTQLPDCQTGNHHLPHLLFSST